MEDFNKQQEEFELIREKIKSRPLNRKKLLRRIVITVLMAIIFGTCACITFFFLEKYFTKVMNPNNMEPVSSEVVIPIDETEMLPQDMMLEEEEEKQNPVIIIESSSDINVLDEYGNLYVDLAEMRKVLIKSLVEVTGVKHDVDWFNNSYEDKETTTGVIVANNGIELLILTDYAAIKNFETINVTFFNGLTEEGTIKEKDKSTGLAVIAIPTERLNSTLTDKNIIATLGNSRLSNVLASPVIALGRPLGNIESVEYGMVTSKGNIISMSDSNYEILTTNIHGNELSNGVLYSLSGAVVGFIYQRSGVGDKSTISAIGISDLKSTIERMSNGKTRPYLGIKGMDVTDQATNNGVPPGAYVKEIDMDSPAMRAGIQSGDVITRFNGSDISTFTVLSQIIAGCEPKQDVEVTVMRPSGEEYVKITMNVTLSDLN